MPDKCAGGMGRLGIDWTHYEVVRVACQAHSCIGVRAGGARGAAAPQILGNSDFLGSERKFGQSQFFLRRFRVF